jgi:acyl-CoA reductase-like NAD-dependent aldehyde dehydrogenase
MVAQAAHAPTPIPEVDKLVARVAARKDDWTKVPIERRIDYLRRCLAGVEAVAERWVADICAVKGIAAGDGLEGEEWLAGPMATARNIRLFIDALEHNGQPPVPEWRTRENGQKIARVFPANLKDKIMFGGFTAEVWIEPGKPATQGRIYRPGEKRAGKTALVLGAGNVSSIPPMDVLYKLFVDDEVCVLKMNPVNAAAGPHIELAFRSLVDDGYVAVCYGAADVGGHLANHAQIDTLHVTGSDKTYDAIVWGTDPAERDRRKKAKDPVNKRPFTAELGCVTSTGVTPGEWSDGDLEFQARHVAGMVAQNASFNCNAAKVLVTAKGWPQREKFLTRVHAALSRAPGRRAYYPGAKQRYQGFLDHYPQAKAVGPTGTDVVPWTVIPDVAAKEGEYALTNEAFCGVLAEVAVDATTAAEFLDAGVKFANDRCWGTLSCCLLVPPSTDKALVERAIADLRYGGVGVNAWPGTLYALVSTTWGAFPGHTPEDIQSGTGVVHNSYLIDHPQKSVIRAPFRIKPTPVWFPDHRNLAQTGRRLTRFEGSASWGRLIGVALAALKG